MPLPRPTLRELRERVKADVSTSVGGGALLPRSVLSLLSEAVAGTAHSLMGAQEYAFRQTFPDTADLDSLERWADLYGVPRRPAARAEGEVIMRGALGSVVPEGARLIRRDGVRFEVVDGGPVDGAFIAVRIRALEAGTTANTEAGVELDLESPIQGMQPVAVVAAGEIAGGANIEGTEELRGRVIDRLRSPGQGGNQADYVRWAREVPGVTRAWCHPLLNGFGTVGVSFMRDGDDDPFPAQEAIDQVQALVDERRPVGMLGVEVFAPTPKPVDLTISIEPDSAAIRAQVEEVIRDLLFLEGGPRPRAAATVLPLSRIREAISSVSGEQSHELLAPATAPTVGPRELLVLGVILWS